MNRYDLEKRGGCLLKIRGSLDGLKSAEKRIALFILSNPSEILNMTINQVAERCQSSYATMNRFCKKMGYSGYKELKDYLYSDVAAGQPDVNDYMDIVISPDITTMEICKNVHSLALKTLSDSFSITDAASIDRITEEMLKAKHTFFIGTGNSGISAQYAYSKFFRIGLPCSAQTDTTYRKMQVSLMGKGDILFAISSSGRSADILECAKIAKENGATVIVLSDFSISPLSKLADYNIYTTPRNVSAFSYIDMPLTIGQFTIIDILYLCCCKSAGTDASENYQKTKKVAHSEKS
ncbi:MAG: MurR/RpiR family transcriptional regulator [Clostridia bacterium]|nr:MurR/RpiR family transcriptional regulator [Clostridia bacterium]